MLMDLKFAFKCAYSWVPTSDGGAPKKVGSPSYGQSWICPSDYQINKLVLLKHKNYEETWCWIFACCTICAFFNWLLYIPDAVGKGKVSACQIRPPFHFYGTQE